METLIQAAKVKLPKSLITRNYNTICEKDIDSKPVVEHPKILLVGTGGIGCELLKNILMSDFRDIEIVDLDTIELSNLNRQFLFRQEDIGKSKCDVAKQRSQAFNSKSKITAHHGNIKSSKFGLAFFRKFDLVINALDNLSTRRHINRICLALEKPFIESGTQGYCGQVYLIKKGLTECYECVEKVIPKTYPVCTIRNTPDKPVHCIAWAKMIFDSLFGPEEANNELSDLKIERKSSEELSEYSKRLFVHLFDENIRNTLKIKPTQNNQGNQKNGSNSQKNHSKKDLKNVTCNKKENDEIYHINQNGIVKDTREGDQMDQDDKKDHNNFHTIKQSFPVPLDLDSFSDIKKQSFESDEIKWKNGAIDIDMKNVKNKDYSQMDENIVLSLEEIVDAFLSAVKRVEKESLMMGKCVFNKDNEAAMDFVTSAANLRMTNYNIERISRFDAKGIAGNIVHAIATTNAVCAGLMAIEAEKILTEKSFSSCRRSWIQLNYTGCRVVQPETLALPDPHCFVCNKQSMDLVCNVRALKVKELFDLVLRDELGMVAPVVDVTYGETSNFISEDLTEWEGNERWQKEYFENPLSHESVKITHGSMLTVNDDEQAFSINLIVIHCQNITQLVEDSSNKKFLLKKSGQFSIDSYNDEIDHPTEKNQTSSKRQNSFSNLESYLPNKKLAVEK